VETFTEELLNRMNIRTVFEIPILGGIPVTESVVLSWGIMAFLVLGSIILVRNLKIIPGKKQLALEIAVGGIWDFFEGLMGERGRRYIPYMATVALFIGTSNLVGLVGLFPPTKDLNVTAGLAVMSIVLIEFAGIAQKGPKRWLKSFAEPMPIIAPINVMEIFIRPLSLCMRLFGNILGGFVVMEMVKIAAPLLVPIPLSFYFDIFDGLIQTYVFVLLTSLFIKEAIED